MSAIRGQLPHANGDRVTLGGSTAYTEGMNPREPHRPCRGDDVEAWLVAEIADCEYEFERPVRNRLVAMLEDYRLHADTGTALLNDVRTNEPVGTVYAHTPVYVNCDKHGYKQAFNVPGLTSGQHICSECI